MTNRSNIHLIGYACGIGAAKQECNMGPETVWQHLKATPTWEKFASTLILKPNSQASGLDSAPILTSLNEKYAATISEYVNRGNKFISVGGDHTGAIGTWSGAASALNQLGLIWVDAHLDSHTPETSRSNNIHGMPLATLLGYGDPKLTQLLTEQPKIHPENLCLIGIRSYEPEELALLEKLNVRIYFMEEIKQRGFDVIWEEALTRVQKNTAAFGISVDVDAIDPNEAPGTGAPEPNGLHAPDIIANLKKIPHTAKWCGLEISEFNPSLDVDNITLQICLDLINSFIEHGNTGE